MSGRWEECLKKKRKLTRNPPSDWKMHINLRLRKKCVCQHFLALNLQAQLRNRYYLHVPLTSTERRTALTPCSCSLLKLFKAHFVWSFSTSSIAEVKWHNAILVFMIGSVSPLFSLDELQKACQRWVKCVREKMIVRLSPGSIGFQRNVDRFPGFPPQVSLLNIYGEKKSVKSVLHWPCNLLEDRQMDKKALLLEKCSFWHFPGSNTGVWIALQQPNIKEDKLAWQKWKCVFVAY